MFVIYSIGTVINQVILRNARDRCARVLPVFQIPQERCRSVGLEDQFGLVKIPKGAPSGPKVPSGIGESQAKVPSTVFGSSLLLAGRGGFGPVSHPLCVLFIVAYPTTSGPLKAFDWASVFELKPVASKNFIVTKTSI
jgi:hypothetical protein